jgi:NAD(P)-dependent dehydrogenase (short-subunit alcohol dehydrogenase family)
VSRFRLDGKVAVVTGGSGGIGSAGAIALAEAGADVAVVGRNRAKLDDAAQAITALGRRSLAVEADIADEDSVSEAATHIQDAMGPVEILFNNAGITSPSSFTDISPEAFRRIVDVNLTGAFLCARAFAPAMIARRGGRIINMGSILSGRGMALRTAYAASKAGLANLGASLCFELGPHGITVNTIGATVIVTDLNRDLIRTQPALYDQILRRTALGRLGEIGDVTGALVFLASDAARFITGQTIYVDGGYTAG